MTFPAIQKFTAPGMLLNQVITYVSLNQTLSAYISGITTQMVARGMTRIGSCDGVTGAFDGVSRWSPTAAVRGGTVTTSQSWDLLQHANGGQTLIGYTGATTDICRISGSPSGAFVIAGTPSQLPTATDEVVGWSGTTVIGTGTANRVYNVQIDAAHNGWRAFIFTGGIMAGPALHGELFDPAFLDPATATCAVPLWWGGVPGTTAGNAPTLMGAYSANANGGVTRMLVSGVAKTVQMGASGKSTSGSFANENNSPQALNGGLIPFRSIGLHSITSTANGDCGRRYDWFLSNEYKACGELDAGMNWVNLNNASTAGANPGFLWSWNGVTATVQTS
jgi:hypothetical protein